MGNRLFTAAVLTTWAASMSWLLFAKILPQMYRGEPPATLAMHDSRPVAWEIEFGGKKCGEAVSQTVDGVLGAKEVHSLVRLRDIPVAQVAPPWMAGLVQSLGGVSLTMRTRAMLDSIGKLSSFNAKIEVNDIPDHVTLSGRVNKGTFVVKARVSGFTKEMEFAWPEDGVLSTELIPDTKLLHASVGRKWVREVYNPFGTPRSPVEMIEAEVMEQVRITHHGDLVNARRIEYRASPTAGVSSDNRLRAELWVSDDGRILRQHAYFVSTKLMFERMDERSSNQIAHDLLELARYAVVDQAERPAEESTASVPTWEAGGGAGFRPIGTEADSPAAHPSGVN
ncbi:hypothetical protein Mal64_04180 [Pseudobythopirellula maris]|uniref:Uncharacterized protein n=1 Tax=Pseudobythopirellula maris TaxID=2527991 RepID=A0A5C5ZSK0_9BACT|nr:hypothetical protein [Pseudobythopirellula maris]TWT90035.1 hypothetical protein Mal64_04180 [Pseudobythopirellula maris]